MFQLDENALICDLAEFYSIYDWTGVPVRTLGILCSGLRHESRIYQKMHGIKADMDTIMLARILDDVNDIIWSRSKHPTSSNRPPRIAETLFESKDENNQSVCAYDTPYEYEQARQRIMEQINNG